MNITEDFMRAQRDEADLRLRQATAEVEPEGYAFDDYNAHLCAEVEREYSLLESPPWLRIIAALVVVVVAIASAVWPLTWWGA